MKTKIFILALSLLLLLCSFAAECSSLKLVWSKNNAFTYAKFSPSGKKIAAGLECMINDTNLKVLIFDASTGDSLMGLSGHRGNKITCLTWLNDSILATGDNLNNYFEPRTLRIWNVNTGENLHTFFNDTLYPWHYYVSQIVYLKGKNKLYVDLFTNRREIINKAPPFEYAYWSDTVLVINTETWEIIKPLSFSDSNSYHMLKLICGAPDGSYYYVEDDVNTELRNPGNDSIFVKSDSTFDFGFNIISLNGKYGIAAISNAVEIYDIENRTWLNDLEFDSINNIDNALISPDSKYIAVTGYYLEYNDSGGIYQSNDRFGTAEIENLSNQTWQDSIPDCINSFEASNDSLYIMGIRNSNLWVYEAPWSPLNSVTTGERKNEQSILYPNPTNGHVYITGLSDAESIQKVKIIEMNGKLVKSINSDKINFNPDGIEFNVSDLPEGFYFVVVGKKVYKLVKE